MGNKKYAIIPLTLVLVLFFNGCGEGETDINTNKVTDININSNDNVNTASEVDTVDFTLSEVEGWLVYENKEYGFSFRYPEDWEVNVLDETTLGLVSPQRKKISSSSPTEMNSDFYLILNKPSTSAPYIEDDFRLSLEKSEREGVIRDLSFISDNRAIFIEHNDFFDQDQYVQYMLLDDDLIISVAYTNNGEYKSIIEYIMNSLNN